MTTKKATPRKRSTVAKKAEPAEVSVLAEVGETGLKHFAGYIDEEFHKDLRGTKAAQVYREMRDNHPLVGAYFLLVDLISRQVDYRVEATPEDERPKDDPDSPMYEFAREFIEGCLLDMSSHPTEKRLGRIEAAVSRALSMGQFGYALQEKVFKIRRGETYGDGETQDPMFHSRFDDGRIGLRKLAPRAQESIEKWEFDENGNLLGVWQRPPPSYILREIPMDKLVHFRLFTEKDNPEGRSLLRPSYVPYYFQRNLQFIEAVGLERNVAGIPDMQVPPDIMAPNASSAQKTVRAKYEKMVRNLRVDQLAGIVRPSEMYNGQETGYKLQLLSASGKSFTEADVPIRRYRQEVVMALIAEHIVVGMDRNGALSLRDSATDLFMLGVAGQIDSILETLNADIVHELLTLNGIPTKYAPYIARGDLHTPDLGALGAYVSAVVSSGVVTPDDKLEDHLREVGNLPQAERGGMTPRPVVDTLTAEPQPGQMALPMPEPVVEEKEEEPDDFLSADQAAEMLGVSKQSIMRAINNGRLPGFKVGATHRIRRKDLMRVAAGGF